MLVTAIGVPSLAVRQYSIYSGVWASIDAFTIEDCGREQRLIHSDMNGCIHKAGADQTMFQHENTTAAAYWGKNLGIAFAIDLVLTGLLIGAFGALRWVVRGFK